ncbi:MAG: SDR family NAD(P)-dependent oxidoreductase [Archangium sp.]|nr:SDR family NAD(P)-dependent oxidoreductase [Archangium sp.]
MTITLITGGNRGLGFETARQLIQRGHTVWLGARDLKRGEEAAKKLGARAVQLDVTNDASVEAAARTVGTLDVLINNAGISGAFRPAPELPLDEFRAVYETNVFGVVRVTRAMLPLLQKSGNPVIVNVGSGLGSFQTVHDTSRIESKLPSLAYSSSKSALSMVTVQYARGLPQLRVNVVDPGYTATEFNRHTGPQTVEDGAEIIVRMACIGRDGPTGTLSDRHGTVGW